MSAPWNWIKDICEWIGNAIKNIVKTLLNVIKNLLVNLWKALKDLALVTIETIKDVGEAVFYIVKLEIGKAFKKLWEALEDIGYWFGRQIQYIVEQLDVLTFGIFSKVWDVLSKVLSLIIIGVAAMSGQVGLAVAMITTSLLSATGAVEDPLLLLVTAVTIELTCRIGPIHNGLVSLVNTFKDYSQIVITDMYSVLKMIARGLINKAREAIRPLVILLGEAFSMSTNEMWNLLKSIAGAIGGTVGEVYNKLYDGIKWIDENLKDAWKWVYDKVKWAAKKVFTGIDYVIDWINKTFGTSFTNISQIIKTMAQKLGTIFDFVYGKIEKGLSGAFSYVKSVFGGTVNTLGNALIKIVNWIQSKGKWAYNFVYNKIADVWDYMVGAVKDVYSWAEGITSTLWETVKTGAIKAWNYIENIIDPVWETVKNAAINAWNYIEDVLEPFTTWVKETIWPTIQDISKTLLDAVDWIEQKGKEVYLWYATHIEPHAKEVLNLIHKAAIITEMVAAIREGKVVRALLTGIGILGGKIEEVSRNVLRFYDGTLTSIVKGIGYSIGWVRKMISDMYRTASIIAEDVAQMGINIGWDVLSEVGAFIADIAKATLGKVYITIGGIEKSVRDWIAYIREPVSRALAIIYQAHADFHKYDYIYRAAYLRQLSTVTGKPFQYIYLPRVAFEGR